MRIEDLVQLLNNRLGEFKLARDYASMNGDLERMNAADKEIISLEDTLFKLNLLIDTSKSAAIKETTLAEVITDGSVSVLGEYDISPYATDPLHEEKIMNILSKMAVMDTAEKIDDYIKNKYLSSPVTGEMVMSAASAYSVDARLMMALMEQDSRFGTVGVAVRTLNPGNVGNNDAGDTVTYESWQEGVTAVAEWLNRHRVSKIISEIPDTATSTPPAATSTPLVATSTPLIITPTATTTTSTATSTPETIPVTTSSTTTVTTATSTPTTTTSTPVTATSTPETIPVTTSSTTTVTTATSTPTTTTSTPVTATSTPETIPVTTSSTTTVTTATSTPTTTTSTPVTATSTPETIPVTTSSTTTVTTATPTE